MQAKLEIFLIQSEVQEMVVDYLGAPITGDDRWTITDMKMEVDCHARPVGLTVNLERVEVE